MTEKTDSARLDGVETELKRVNVQLSELTGAMIKLVAVETNQRHHESDIQELKMEVSVLRERVSSVTNQEGNRVAGTNVWNQIFILALTGLGAYAVGLISAGKTLGN